ncbi:MAG TPA: hypothetical protein PLO44_00565 [Candidatus Paceibacterota bacterium]|nr:hypothetical protein [Candidatus Paceibacterota bacterium]
MRKTIHKLRQKPEEERRHILHISIIIIAIVMILLWAFSLGKNLSQPEVKEKVKQDLQPFSVLKDNLSEGYKSVSE